MVEVFELVVRDFAVIMIIASVMALISHRLKQPMVIAYIAAGMIIGPHTPPFSLITQIETLQLFAEIGVILLLFVVGMEFPIEKLKKVGGRASIIAAAEAGGTFLAGYGAGQLLGFSFYDSLFAALAISVTSTVIVMRVLQELKMIRDEASTLILGVAIIEDIIIISLLAVLQSVATTGSLSFSEIGISVGLVLAFCFLRSGIIGLLQSGNTIPNNYFIGLGSLFADMGITLLMIEKKIKNIRDEESHNRRILIY